MIGVVKSVTIHKDLEKRNHDALDFEEIKRANEAWPLRKPRTDLTF